MSGGGEVSGLKEIESEDEWHVFLKDAMEASGWYIKHEVPSNDGEARCDFLAYHSAFNTQYETGEWVGIECKYSDYQNRTRAVQAARQIDTKYRSKKWSTSGLDVKFWVVAPYVAQSHRGSKRQIAATRGREIGAAQVLTELGFGYLFSWHPRPGIGTRWLGWPQHVFPIENTDKLRYVSTPGIPAFQSKETLNPWDSYYVRGYEVEEQADYVEAIRGMSGLRSDWDELREIDKKYAMAGGSDD